MKLELREVSTSFKMSDVKPTYITLKELKEKMDKQTKVEHLYPRIANYNQRATLQRFIEKLNDRVGDRLLINSYGLHKCNTIERNGDKIIEDKNFDFLFQTTLTFGCHLTFSIDNFVYYIQFADNPLFEDSSYIISKKVMQQELTNRYAVQEYYGGGETNINDLLDDVFSSQCDIEFSADNLFAYFMDKCYQQESKRYCGKGERLTLLAGGNLNEIITIG